MNTQEVGRLRTWFITVFTTARTTIYEDGVLPLPAGKNDGWCEGDFSVVHTLHLTQNIRDSPETDNLKSTESNVQPSSWP